MDQNKKGRGGKREGAGRFSKDKKVPVTTYVETSVLTTFGEDLNIKEQRLECRSFFTESLAQRAKSLAR